jgi:hypothetical protein
MHFRGGGIGHKGMLDQIAGLRNREQPLSTADQMNEDLDAEDIEGLGENDEQEEDEEEDEEDQEDEEEESDESDESLIELDLDGEEGGEDEYNILGFAAF